MSQDFPSPRSVNVSFTSAGVGSLLSVIISPSIVGVTPSIFIQANDANTGFIRLGIASTVAQMSAQVGSALVGSNSIITLDSGQSFQLRASDWKTDDDGSAYLTLSDFIIAASVTADQAVITFFV